MEIKLHQKMHEKVHFKRRFAHQCCQGAEENSATSGFSLKNVDWHSCRGAGVCFG